MPHPSSRLCSVDSRNGLPAKRCGKVGVVVGQCIPAGETQPDMTLFREDVRRRCPGKDRERLAGQSSFMKCGYLFRYSS